MDVWWYGLFYIFDLAFVKNLLPFDAPPRAGHGPARLLSVPASLGGRVDERCVVVVVGCAMVVWILLSLGGVGGRPG